MIQIRKQCCAIEHGQATFFCLVDLDVSPLAGILKMIRVNAFVSIFLHLADIII